MFTTFRESASEITQSCKVLPSHSHIDPVIQICKNLTL